MKNEIVKASLAIGLLLVTSQFATCDSKKEVKTTETATSTTQIDTPIEKNEIFRQPVVFIAGIDSEEQNFYKSARDYFIEKEYEVVDYAFSMQEVFTWLNNNYDGTSYGEIHIVSNSNPWKGLEMETLIKGDRVTTENLRKVITQGTLPTLKQGISSNTKVVFHSKGIGQDTQLMKTLKDAFVANEVPNVIASPYADVFDGELSIKGLRS